jgi:hypothetical protein
MPPPAFFIRRRRAHGICATASACVCSTIGDQSGSSSKSATKFSPETCLYQDSAPNARRSPHQHVVLRPLHRYRRGPPTRALGSMSPPRREIDRSSIERSGTCSLVTTPHQASYWGERWDFGPRKRCRAACTARRGPPGGLFAAVVSGAFREPPWQSRPAGGGPRVRIRPRPASNVRAIL